PSHKLRNFSSLLFQRLARTYVRFLLKPLLKIEIEHHTEPRASASGERKTEPMFLSKRKREANRANAQKSTGPLTEIGRERVSRNARKHGLTGAFEVLEGED